MTDNEYEVSFGRGEYYKIRCGDGEHNKDHLIEHFKRMNWTINELYLNKAAKNICICLNLYCKSITKKKLNAKELEGT